MLSLFNQPWNEVPTVWIDTEATGKQPGKDRAVQVGVVRFEQGAPVGSFCSLVCPGDVKVSEEALAVHGISDEQVADAYRIEAVFEFEGVRALLRGAQPGAYNAAFDRYFVPPFGDDWTWPWLDSLSMVRFLDRFERGQGRHRLEAAAARHGVMLAKAHDAEADARAAGELFYLLGPRIFTGESTWTLGQVLERQRLAEVKEWARFTSWRAQKETTDAA